MLAISSGCQCGDSSFCKHSSGKARKSRANALSSCHAVAPSGYPGDQSDLGIFEGAMFAESKKQKMKLLFGRLFRRPGWFGKPISAKGKTQTIPVTRSFEVSF